MAPASPLNLALTAIAELYAAEGRVAASRTAKALRQAIGHPFGHPLGPPPQPCSLDAHIRACLATSTHPVAQAVLAAQASIPWGVNPVAGRMTSDAAGMVAVSTLLDPDGPIRHPDFRLGLLYMRPGSYYPLHNHDADETYVLIAGSAFWTAGEDRRWRHAGEAIHHPSRMPHAFRTEDSGFVALWRWSGDINAHSYSFLPDPQAVPQADPPTTMPAHALPDLPPGPSSLIPAAKPGR